MKIGTRIIGRGAIACMKRDYSDVWAIKGTEKRMEIMGKSFICDSMTNITSGIIAKTGQNLYRQPGHPLKIMSNAIRGFFVGEAMFRDAQFREHTDPIVTVKQNFDDLLFDAGHSGRSVHDSYYINGDWLLRTHMTANEREVIKEGARSFLLVGDVYRRDEIDKTHYPVFHQMEGVCIFESAKDFGPATQSQSVPTIIKKALAEQLIQDGHELELVGLVLSNLYQTVNRLLQFLFGPEIPIRWQSCYFPFTQPSVEVEILHKGKWIEVLGSGVLQQNFLAGSGYPTQLGWAFGIGLERLAMILFDIPDIRLFWSKDPRFLEQFNENRPITENKFVPFSKYPEISRDLSFWIGQQGFEPNELFEVIRDVAGELVENVQLIDSYENSIGKVSKCYRIVYRSMDRSLTDAEVNSLQDHIRTVCSEKLFCLVR